MNPCFRGCEELRIAGISFDIFVLLKFIAARRLQTEGLIQSFWDVAKGAVNHTQRLRIMCLKTVWAIFSAFGTLNTFITLPTQCKAIYTVVEEYNTIFQKFKQEIYDCLKMRLTIYSRKYTILITKIFIICLLKENTWISAATCIEWAVIIGQVE